MGFIESLCGPLLMFSLPQAEHKHPTEHQDAGEWVIQRLHEHIVVFWIFCLELNIKNLYSTPHYPQSNGKTEATNKTLLVALKKMLEITKGKWVDELLGVLWAYRTTTRRPTWATPFALAYEMEVVIPTKIGMPTAKTTVQGQKDDNEELTR